VVVALRVRTQHATMCATDARSSVSQEIHRWACTLVALPFARVEFTSGSRSLVANPLDGSPRGGIFFTSGGWPELASFGAHHGALFVIWGAVIACVVRDKMPDFAAICRDLQ